MFSFPSLVGYPHRDFGTTMILNLSPLVYQCLRATVVQAIHTLALASTHDTILKALNERRKWIKYIEECREKIK